MSIFNDFFVKEKPVFTGIIRGIGGFGFGKSAAGDAGGGPFSASGGDLSAESTPDGNIYHVFYNPGTLTVSASGQCDILLVAGGASGRGGHGPGGAGGQVVLYESETLPDGSYPITVGDGGAASAPQGINAGNNTTGFTYTAYGAGQDPATYAQLPSPLQPNADNKSVWGPGPEYGNFNSPSFGSPGPNAGVGAGAVGGSPSPQYRPGGNGRQVPSAFLPTNAPASLISALGSTPAPSPAWRYFGGGGGQAGGNGFETSQGGNGGLGGGGGAGTGPGGPGGDPGYGYPFTPGGPLGDAGQDRRGGGGGGGGIGACGTTYCPAKKGGDGVVVVRYPA